jgi:hypothetical protein
MKKVLTAKDYESLADLRHHIRRFLHFSELAVCEVGLEPRQHQLMLALKGLPRGTRPRIGELAERLPKSGTTARWNWWTGLPLADM